MTLKIAVPKLDNPKLQAVSSKLRAWWNGEENSVPIEDAEGVPTAANEQPEESQEEPKVAPVSEVTKKDNKKDNAAKQAELIKYSVLEKLFGEGRAAPADGEVDKSIIDGMPFTHADKKQKLYLFGVEPCAAIFGWLNRYELEIEAYENNPVVLQRAKDYLSKKGMGSKIKFHSYDKSPKSLPKNKASQLLIYAQATSFEAMEGIAFSLARILKPGGEAILFDYFAKDGETEIATDKQHGRSFMYESDIAPLMDAAGIVIVEQEDIGAHLLNSYRQRRTKTIESWDTIQADLIKLGGIEVANQALEATAAWQKRIEAIKKGKIIVKKIRLMLD